MPFIKDYRLNLKVFDNKLFSIQVKVMRVVGYLIDESQQFELWHFWRSVFITFSISLCCAFEFIKLIIDGIGDAIASAAACLFLSISIVIINTLFRRKRLARMLAFVQEDVDKLLLKSDEREAKIFDEIHRYMFKITVCIGIPCLVGGFIIYIDTFYWFVFNPDSIINLEQIENGTVSQAMIIRIFPFRELHDDLIMCYIFPMYTSFLATIMIPVWHSFITSLMSYVILKCKIMNKRLSEMDISKVILDHNESIYYSSLVGEEERTNYLRTRLCKFYVNEQVRTRWFVNNLQELICIPVFADFIIFSILICFLLYQISIGSPTDIDFIFNCLFLFAMSFILWLYHWHATLVRENSDLMCFAIYSCDWYNYPVKVQKMVHLIMMISASPLEMKAIFISLNLTTFIEIIRASYSYFNILREST